MNWFEVDRFEVYRRNVRPEVIKGHIFSMTASKRVADRFL